METKKISFGFMKTKKQEKPEVVEKRDYIECVEEKAIKVIGGETIKEDSPLVIPMKPNTLVTAERLKEIAEKVESALEPEEQSKEPTIDLPPENETLEQMATRELLQEAKQQKVVEQPTLLVPLPAKPIMDGQKESTLDDYESVPIQEFGLAMLRGMGWTPGQEQSKYKQPQLRPKGLGLGADKVLAENKKKKSSKEKEEELAIVKGSFVKVTTGKYNGCYGKVVSLDEDNGRIMIDIAVKKETVSLSEFMVQAVTRSEFDKQSKVINADSYAEYKKSENDNQKFSKQQNSPASRESSSSHKYNDVNNKDSRERGRRKEDRYNETKEDKKYSNGNNKDKESRARSQRSRNNSTSDEDVSHRSRYRDKKYSSNDSLDSDSDKKDRRKKRHSSSSSDSSEADYRRKHKSKSSKSSKEKRDIDKKRKGKKKKRDRDRSPNYRKHKK
ncbi:G-patch domain and KOW motifs-containing protein-like [Epargyreus clarus]|uniref:G-patch domain and KOW motifs-containing protein-like n=1 Tax=Epargyreus clarus TaxID=520877 RepID=UPI003C2E6756